LEDLLKFFQTFSKEVLQIWPQVSIVSRCNCPCAVQ